MATTKKKPAAATLLTIARITAIAKEVLGDAVSCFHDGKRRVRFSVGETPLVDLEHLAMTAHYPVWYSRFLRRRSKAIRSEADARKVFTDIKAMLEQEAAERLSGAAHAKRNGSLRDRLGAIPLHPCYVIAGGVSKESTTRPYRVTVKLDLLTEDQAVQVARAIATLVTTLDVTQDGSQRDTPAASETTALDAIAAGAIELTSLAAQGSIDAAFWKSRYDELRAAYKAGPPPHESFLKMAAPLFDEVTTE